MAGDASSSDAASAAPAPRSTPRSFVFDYTNDPGLRREATSGGGAAGRLEMLSLATYEDILERVNIGFK